MCCSECDGSGWMWPNLGVNIPGGAVMAVASNQAAMRRMFGASYYIRCDVCNSDRSKPHPDQDKIDLATEIDRQAKPSRVDV